MRGSVTPFWRRVIVSAITILSMLSSDVALAQSGNCAALSRTLSSLNGNRDFRTLRNNVAAARKLAAELQDMESLFVRGGCQKQLNQQGRLSGQCRTLGRRIVRGREDYNKLSARVETGQAVMQQREQILQQVARFRCNTQQNSSSRVEVRTRNNNIFDNLFDRLFGNDVFIDSNDFLYGGQSTLRTVCVRTCDGYYWPVSFSTVGQFLPDDAAQCQASCPGGDVSLYYYSNPGETPDDMIDMNGNPYKSLPTAFAYRTQFDKACTCKQQIDYGAIVVQASTAGQSERKIVEFEDLTFPLPIPDPRERKQEVTVAELIVVPLPVRRPVRPGEEAPKRIISTPVVSTQIREAVVGGKTVRIVGPDTPYAQSEAEGS